MPIIIEAANVLNRQPQWHFSSSNACTPSDYIWVKLILCCFVCFAERLNVLYERNWTMLVHEQLRRFEGSIIKATKGGLTEAMGERLPRWTFTEALLYSITLITTIGNCKPPSINHCCWLYWFSCWEIEIAWKTRKRWKMVQKSIDFVRLTLDMKFPIQFNAREQMAR